MDQVRSFIAIELPPGIKAELTYLEERLKKGQHPFVKWVDPESIHLTLKFLGNISTTAVPQVIEVLTRAAQGISPFSLQLGELGAFPNLKQPRVVWVGIVGDVETLVLLQRAVDSLLSPLGFPPESRSFSPHLTLGRLREKVSPWERQDFARLALSIRCETGHSFDIMSLSLIKSQLTPLGAIYSRLASVELKGQQAV